MGKLINFRGDSKVIKRICELLNVFDVRINDNSIVDNNGIVDLTMIANMQDQIQAIIDYLGLDAWWTDENGNIFTDEEGYQFTFSVDNT